MDFEALPTVTPQVQVLQRPAQRKGDVRPGLEPQPEPAEVLKVLYGYRQLLSPSFPASTQVQPWISAGASQSSSS